MGPVELDVRGRGQYLKGRPPFSLKKASLSKTKMNSMEWWAALLIWTRFQPFLLLFLTEPLCKPFHFLSYRPSRDLAVFMHLPLWRKFQPCCSPNRELLSVMLLSPLCTQRWTCLDSGLLHCLLPPHLPFLQPCIPHVCVAVKSVSPESFCEWRNVFVPCLL